MFALPNLGMSLAASGRYAEAAAVFDEARRFGREYGVGTLLARAISMSAGYHLDVSDFATNEALADEARELAASLSFTPPLVCARLDLMMNFARQHEVARAEALIDEIAGLSVTATGWHDWLWRIRLAEARAEIALARQDWTAALRWAGVAIDEARVCRRVKYEVLGLITRGGRSTAWGAHANRSSTCAQRWRLLVRSASQRCCCGPRQPCWPSMGTLPWPRRPV